MVLNKAKVITALRQQPPTTFTSYQQQRQTMQNLWHEMMSNHNLYQAITHQAQQAKLSLPQEPGWIPVHHIRPEAYTISAVDGSQIFPHAHAGIHCYLLNIGVCTLSYLPEHSSALLSSDPSFFEPDELISEDYISTHRTLLELKIGTECIHAQKNHILLIDGPLIPYQNSSETLPLDEIVSQWEKSSAYVVGYVSMPHSRMLFPLLEIAARLLEQPYDGVSLSDSALLAHIMPANYRTHFWHIPHKPYLRCFFYHSGYEIVRIEIPAYLATPENTNYILQAIHHQVSLGYGYPLALAEAHVQATISARDQEWFYAVVAQHNPFRTVRSYKHLRKRHTPL